MGWFGTRRAGKLWSSITMDANRPDTENMETPADNATANSETSAAGEDRADEMLQTLQDELVSTRDQLLRTMADFQNFRKRKQEDEARIRQFATESMVSALLPVLDNFERTVEHLNTGASAEAMLDGIRAVEKQLRSALESQNVKRIESIGKPFDPNFHEAIAMEASEEHPAETILAELEPGYRMGDKVLRPARVKVAS